MPRRARIHYVSLRSSLVNLPISIYGPLLERGVRPQGLAVHLSLATPGKQSKASENGSTVKGEAYVGWTGMASASSLANFNTSSSGERGMETIEIDPQFAEGLGFSEGDIVEIGLLHGLSYAESVETEPLTADDWEILESHASHVESTLLSQVRVAMVGQEIDVWVLGRTRVRLKVVSLGPSTSGKALLLTTNTEVSIAPKTRLPHGKSKPNGAASTSNGKADGAFPNAKNQDEETLANQRTRILRVLPSRVLPPYSPSCAATEDGSIAAIAFVSRVTFDSLTGSSPTSENYAQQPRFWTAKVRHLSPPADPSQEQTAAPAAPAAPLPRILVPSDPTAEKTSTPAAALPKDETLVGWSGEVPIPDDHIVFYGSASGVEDWDLVQVTFTEASDHVVVSEQSDGDAAPKRLRPGHVPKLAGMDDVIQQCKDFCLSTFALHAFSKRIRGVPGLLVTGRSGTGKTSVLRTVAKLMQDSPKTYAYTLYVDAARYTETPVSKVKSQMQWWLDKAIWHRPCIIVIDNLDKLMGVELEHADSFRTRHITELFIHMFSSSARMAAPNAKGIILLAAAESRSSIHPHLSAVHMFEEIVHLKPPGKDARKEILAQIVGSHIENSDLIQDPSAPLNFTALATQTEGYSATDLKDLVARAVHRAAIRAAANEHDPEYQPMLGPDDFAAAHVDFVPLSLRDVKLQKSDIAWSDIGGLHETRRTLRETLEWPTKYGPIFAQSPLRLRSGLLLYGFPGCGKTLLASAVARECGLNFISVKGPEILNKYIGASEKSVRDLFERASAAKPCVLFFDEFDSIAPKRGHDSTGVTDRVVNQMLTQMDGAEGLEGVYVLAATSRPDLIDSALLRPGRLDKSLFCNMPDASERKEILEAVARKVTLSPEVDLGQIAQDTEGYSGADLQALVYNAHLEVIHETIAATSAAAAQTKGGPDAHEEGTLEYITFNEASGKQVKSRAEEAAFQRRLQRMLSKPKSPDSPLPTNAAAHQTHEIREEHLRRVLSTTRPSVPPEERARLGRIYHAFMSGRSGDLPVPPDAGGVGHRVSLM